MIILTKTRYTLIDWLERLKEVHKDYGKKIHVLKEFKRHIDKYSTNHIQDGVFRVSDVVCYGYPSCSFCMFQGTICDDVIIDVDINPNSNNYVLGRISDTLDEIINSFLYNKSDKSIVDENGWSLDIEENTTYIYKNNHLSVIIELFMKDDKVDFYKHWVTVDLCNKNVANDYSTSYTFKDKEHIKKIKEHFGILLEDNILCM